MFEGHSTRGASIVAIMQKKFVASVVAVLCALSIMGATPASPTLPDTPAGKAFSAWLAAFDSGDRETLKRFFETYEPEQLPKIDRELAFGRMTGGYDLRKIVESAPTELTVLVQERLSDQFARVTLQIKDTDPLRIGRGYIVPVDRPAEFAIPHAATQSALVTQLQQQVQSATARDQFAGAVLVAKNGTPVFEQAYGLADRAHNVANTVDTRFRLGSMNKMFTATAIMQLAQAGKIDLDQPFGTYLTDYPNKSVSSAVSIRQLLTHTGGTGDIFGPEFEKNRLKLRTLQDYIDLYGNRPLSFTPGSKWEYSNYGFILLGAVIEKVSGQNYYDYVRAHIYVPAGMTATASDPEDGSVANRSTGYTQMEAAAWKPNTDTLPYRGTSAGGGYSTVGDLLRFANALQNHVLLNATYTQLMTSGKVDTPIGKYGYGFDVRSINGTRCFGHGGGAPGMNGDLEICPDSHYVIAVLANLDPPAANRISDFVANRLPLH